MFLKSCGYGIRALVYSAHKWKQGLKAGIIEIALSIDASEKFIVRILHELTKHKLVQSQRWPSGSFYVDAKSLNNTLADIVKVIDDYKLFTGCGLGLDYCPEKKLCPTHFEFIKVRKGIFDLLQASKLGNCRNNWRIHFSI